jgi:hypothetical protein
MRQITSRKQDSKVKAELLKEKALKLKLAHMDNDAIAEALFKDGIGVEKPDEPLRPYSAAYVGKVIREALKEVAADRSTYGKEVAILIENDLDSLIEAWRPLALGESTDDDGNLLPPSVKAAEIVRKCLSDKANLLGSNAPVETIVSVRVDSALSGFVDTLRQLMPEDHFQSVIAAIDTATQLNSEYWSQNKQIEGDSAIIDCEVLD